jgi:vitellogenic carboxypeptidase-like protein
MQKALNVGTHTWSFANNTASNALNADEQLSVLHLLPHLINNYRILIYTGNVDLNCNVLGVDNYLNLLPWSDFNEWYTAPRVFWKVDNVLAGYARSLGNLTNLVVRNSGHEVRSANNDC